jgi:hypothetical protein
MTNEEFQALKLVMFTGSREDVDRKLKEALGQEYRKGMIESRNIKYTAVKVKNEMLEPKRS